MMQAHAAGAPHCNKDAVSSPAGTSAARFPGSWKEGVYARGEGPRGMIRGLLAEEVEAAVRKGDMPRPP